MTRIALAAAVLSLPVLAGAAAAQDTVQVRHSTSDGVSASVVIDDRKTGTYGGAGVGVLSSYGAACVAFSYQVPQCVG